MSQRLVKPTDFNRMTIEFMKGDVILDFLLTEFDIIVRSMRTPYLILVSERYTIRIPKYDIKSYRILSSESVPDLTTDFFNSEIHGKGLPSCITIEDKSIPRRDLLLE